MKKSSKLDFSWPKYGAPILNPEAVYYTASGLSIGAVYFGQEKSNFQDFFMKIYIKVVEDAF